MTTTEAIQSGTVLLRPVADPTGVEALLSWRGGAPDATTFVQVYVDGELYDVATDPNVREMWLRLPRSRNVSVELRPAPGDEAWIARPELLDSWTPPWSPSTELAIVRDESLPIDTQVVVTIDDTDEPPRPLWGPTDSRAGFGGLLGYGGFGFDDATAPGLGLGEFGVGRFGSGGSAWRWRRRDLPAGDHSIAARIESAEGDELGSTPPIEFTVDRPPDAAFTFTADTGFTLRWNLQED